MTQTTPTCLWNDSASHQELTYSIEHGAVGATCNPVIVRRGAEQGNASLGARARPSDRGIPHGHGGPDRLEGGGGDVQEAAALLKPIFDAAGGQERPAVHPDRSPPSIRDTEAIVDQAVRFSQLAPNMIVKIPVTRAGNPGHRGSHLPRREHQCHGLLHPAAVHCRGRGGGARAHAAAERGPGHRLPWARSAPSWWAGWMTG